VADRTIVLATNKRHAVRGLTVVNPQEFSAYQEDNDDLTYIVDMSSYLDGATISSVTRTSTGVTVSNTSNTTTRITQRLKGFGYVDFKVTTSSGDVEEFKIVIRSRTPSVYSQTASVPEASLDTLTANRTYYVRVNGTDGSSGLVNTDAGAFATLQKALDTYAALDLAGYIVTIQMGDGTHTSGGTLRANPKGAWASLPLQIIGNTSDPASCIISTTSANCLKVDAGAQAYINGFELRAATSGRGLLSTANSYLVFGTSMRFGACATYHMEATTGGNIISLGGYTVCGNSVAHQHCTSNGHILIQSGTITLTGTPAFSAYYIGINGAYVQYAPTVTFSGSATGTRYFVHDNGTLYTGNDFDRDYFPGSTDGSMIGGGIVDDVSSDTWRVMGTLGATASVTGTTNETVLSTVTIPGGSIGPNGVIRIYSLWSNTNDASGKTARIRLNGLGTQAVMGAALSTSGVYADYRQVHNANSESSQKVMQFTFLGGFGASTTVTTGAIDTTADISLVFTGQLTDTADTISIEAYTVEVCYRP